MIVADVFKVYLYADPLVALYDYSLEEAEDITSGILNVNIVEGTDIYEGPQQQIDTGQFTIVTRNPAMDPKINPNLKYNSTIKFWDERTGEFFRGFVTDVQVEYQRNDNPIITITGTDIFGAAQRVVVNQTTHNAIKALSTGTTWNGLTFSEFLPYMLDFTSKYLDLDAFQSPDSPTNYGFWFPASGAFGEETLGNLRYAPARYIPEVGESYLDILNKYAQTNLTSFSAKGEFGFDYIYVNSFPKYDPNYWPPQEDPYVTYTDYDFSSDPADDKPYETILIDNGYNKVTNQVDISNEYRFVSSGEVNSESQSFTRTSAESIEEYAISRASVSTIYPSTTPGLTTSSFADRYSQNIFQLTDFPGQEIQQITFDNARYEDVQNESSYSNYALNQMIRIKHQINNDETLDRIYDIAGITHSISPDKWEMGFTLKPPAAEFIFKIQGSIPTLTMNSLTGDTNFNFTATLENVDPANIGFVYWALSATEPDQIGEIWPYAIFGKMYKDGFARFGNTQTWNFDDDGILEEYSFDPDSTYTNPTDNRYGGYGPGIWHVYAFIFLTNDTRGMLVLQQELTVGTPVVEADFGWLQNLTNSFGQVGFTDTSVNNELGEPDSYLWDFGDGTTSSEKNPTHTYNPSGPTDTEFEVSLTVFAYGEGGVKVPNTKTETITLIQPEMTADFTWTANAQVITFTNTSTNVGFEEPDAYLWDFGDGTTSTLKNPVHTFPVTDVNVPQSYTVTLTIRNIWEQTESVTKTITTTALNESGTFPVRYIKFSIDPYTKPGSTSGIPMYSVTPVMNQLVASTSGTNVNLAYLKPTIGFNDLSIPRLFWLAMSGQNVQSSLGYEYFLTRQASSNQDAFGLGAGAKPSIDPTWKPVRWELVVDLGTNTQLIKDIILRFADLIDQDFPGQIFTEDFYPRINIEFANTVTDYTPNPPGTYGPATLNGNWVNVGYIKLSGGRMDPTQPVGVRTSATKSIFKMRPLPLNIPYFNYTFNDKIVSFTSVETADSYAWTFGDGTTSTDKDPVKTYASYGTYTVTLAVTNGGIVTRTTTEPVIVQAPVI